MDIFVVVLVVAITYAVSKLVEKLRKEYQVKIANYARIQGNEVSSQSEITFFNSQVATSGEGTIEVQFENQLKSVAEPTHVIVPLPVDNPPRLEEKVWAGKMNANAVINGVIFAEIVQPPRAYRPFVRRK